MSSAPARRRTPAERVAEIRQTWAPNGMVPLSDRSPLYEDLVFLLDEIDRLNEIAGEVYEVIENVPPIGPGSPVTAQGHGLFRTKVKALNERRRLARLGRNSTFIDTRTVR